MGAGIMQMRCGVMDPVLCPEVFSGLGTMHAARQMLAHMNTHHVHHENVPGWGLYWVDERGHKQHIGVDHAAYGRVK